MANQDASADWAYPQAPILSYSDLDLHHDEVSSASFVNPALVMGGSSGGAAPYDGEPAEYGTGIEQYSFESASSRPKIARYDSYTLDSTYPGHESTTPAYSPPATVPALSPSSFSSPTSSTSSHPSTISSSSSLPSPDAFDPSHSLPSPEIFDPMNVASGPATSMGFAYGSSQGSRFAEIQDSYLREKEAVEMQTAQLLPSPRPRYLSSPSSHRERHRSPAASAYSPSSSPSSAHSHLSPSSSNSFSPYERRGSVGSNPLESSRSPRGPLARGTSKRNLAIPQYDLSPSMAAGYRMASEMGTLPGGMDDPVAPATDEAMDQLMLEIGTILGPDVMGSIPSPPPPSHPSPQTYPVPIPEPRRESRPQTERRRPAPLPTLQRRPSYNNRPTIEVSHSNQDDWHLLEPTEPHRYPSSAPAWQTTFELHHEPPSYERYGPPPAHPPQQFHQQIPQRNDYEYPPTQYFDSHSHGMQHLAPMSRPRSAPQDSAPSYPSVMNGPPSHSHHQFGGYPASPLGYSTAQQQYSPPLQPSVSYNKPQTKAARAPRKRATSAKSAAPKAAMFINYGASDAKKLLSGVAPSGSSKRKREEEEAAARERAAARQAAAAQAAAPLNPSVSA